MVSDDLIRYMSKHLPQDHGFVSFVRLVRKSGRITLGAGDRFMVDPSLAHQYVLAIVDLARKVVHNWHNDQLIHTYDFSPDTVGAWVSDDDHTRHTVDDEVIKVQITM